MPEATGAASSTLAPDASSRTDRLELQQQLSGGTVGAVHRARNPKLNRTVALRQVQVPDWLDDANDLIKRFLAEARSASQLDHPNIAHLYTGGYKGFTIFLTSEFVDGPTVKDFATSRNLGMNELMVLAKQLCAALDYAHQKNVIHYALTPANVKVASDGTLKILDFGLLREKQLYSPTPAKRLQSEHYLSPEQLKHKPVDPAANLFTAATILYELFTTRNPFAGKHLGEVDRNITDVDPTPANQAHARVSDPVARVLMKALSKNPAARYASCAEFARALDEASRVSGGKNSAPKMPAEKISSTPAPTPRAAPVSAPKFAPATPPKTDAAPPQVSPVVGPATTNGNREKVGSMAAAGAAIATAIPKSTLPQPNAHNGQPQRAVSARPAVAHVPAVHPAPPPSSRIPARMLRQWKLVGGAIALLFVVSALAISLNHRSKVSLPPEASHSTDPAAATPESAIVHSTTAVITPAQPAVDAREVEARENRRKSSKAEANPVVATVADGQLAISSQPDGASIGIEGRTETGKTPQVLGALAPGVYRVTLSKPGYATEIRSIEVASGNRASLDVKLTPLRATLSVAGTPSGARISIDGKDTGKATPAQFTLDPATHNVSLHMEGYFDSSTEIKLSAGQALSYAPALKPAGRTDDIKVVGGFRKLFGGGGSGGMSLMEIKTDPKGARVIINGSTLPKPTPFEIRLDPGNYDIVLQKEGYKPVHKFVTTQANQKFKIDEQLSK